MSGPECIFCKIVAGEIPTDIVYQDEQVLAFRDIEPQAPTHVLIVPREHIPSLLSLSSEHQELIWHMVSTANEIARKEGLSERGYRLAVSCGSEGGQLVPHLHMHLIGGRVLTDALG
jgi:histidine triad (HIT) family protein